MVRDGPIAGPRRPLGSRLAAGSTPTASPSRRCPRDTQGPLSELMATFINTTFILDPRACIGPRVSPLRTCPLTKGATPHPQPMARATLLNASRWAILLRNFGAGPRFNSAPPVSASTNWIRQLRRGPQFSHAYSAKFRRDLWGAVSGQTLGGCRGPGDTTAYALSLVLHPRFITKSSRTSGPGKSCWCT